MLRGSQNDLCGGLFLCKPEHKRNCEDVTKERKQPGAGIGLAGKAGPFATVFGQDGCAPPRGLPFLSLEVPKEADGKGQPLVSPRPNPVYLILPFLSKNPPKCSICSTSVPLVQRHMHKGCVLK